MKTITYRNEKGEFARENVNYGFELQYDFFTAKCSRNGQISPEKGNDVEVKLAVTKTANPTGFKEKLFERRLDCYYNVVPQWQYDEEVFMSFTFSAPTWREAFKKAKDYIFAEIAKYETLVAERAKALIDAEF